MASLIFASLGGFFAGMIGDVAASPLSNIVKNKVAGDLIDILFGSVLSTIIFLIIAGVFIFSIILMISGTVNDSTSPSSFIGIGLRTNDENLGLGIMLFLITSIFMLSSYTVYLEEYRLSGNIKETSEFLQRAQSPVYGKYIKEDAETLQLSQKQFIRYVLSNNDIFKDLNAAYNNIEATKQGKGVFLNSIEYNQAIQRRNEALRELKKEIVSTAVVNKSRFRNKQGLSRKEQKDLLRKYRNSPNTTYFNAKQKVKETGSRVLEAVNPLTVPSKVTRSVSNLIFGS